MLPPRTILSARSASGATVAGTLVPEPRKSRGFIKEVKAPSGWRENKSESKTGCKASGGQRGWKSTSEARHKERQLVFWTTSTRRQGPPKALMLTVRHGHKTLQQDGRPARVRGHRCLPRRGLHGAPRRLVWYRRGKVGNNGCRGTRRGMKSVPPPLQLLPRRLKVSSPLLACQTKDSSPPFVKRTTLTLLEVWSLLALNVDACKRLGSRER